MSGVTKHIYDREIRDIIMLWNKQIKEIQSVLPQYYTDADIVSAIKYYYPHEWNSVKFKYSYYQAKDKCLKKRFNKVRYGMQEPEILLRCVDLYKKVVSLKYRNTYANNYSKILSCRCVIQCIEQNNNNNEKESDYENSITFTR